MSIRVYSTYIVSCYFVNGTPRRLFVDWHLKKDNSFHAHYVVFKTGSTHEQAVVVEETKISYQRINGVVLPKSVLKKHYRETSREMDYQWQLAVDRISLNSELSVGDAVTSERLTEELLFGAEDSDAKSR